MARFMLETKAFDRKSGQEVIHKYSVIEYASPDGARQGLRALNTEKPRSLRRFEYRLWPLGEELLEA